MGAENRSEAFVITRFTLIDWPIIVSMWPGTKLTVVLAGGAAGAACGAVGTACGTFGDVAGGAAGGLPEAAGGATTDAPGLGGTPAFGAGSPSVCGGCAQVSFTTVAFA